ncbi:DUF3152 domain-containing protein [Streptomyces sp. P01-B04]|uniref:DUF3152 domain-containing protein n=1 Tax=Streptomyces poriferorum TaxID=2798799 RepID=UPI001C5E237A|nr:DUF3152 domain-containing protein [Streptomyces poriferorum]MBW5253097.1 DUF3152 domain-containing protein [Streptomyces poriferorum]MBW5260332.1 DUF3152 domain-containing protein [Streptomyces poriferorum]
MRRELIRGVGRHSRMGPAPSGPESGPSEANAEAGREGAPPAAGNGRRRRPGEAAPGTDGHTPIPDTPQVRGGHPEQREPGGGWGTGPLGRYGDRPAPPHGTGQGRIGSRTQTQAQARTQAPGRPQGPQSPQGPRPQTSGRPQGSQNPRGPQAPRNAQETAARPLIPGPRREFVEAFDSPPAPPAPRRPAATPSGPADPYRSVTDRDENPPDADDRPAAPGDEAKSAKAGKGRTFTGIAAAAVTTVLAVVVAGQVAHDSGSRSAAAQPAGVDRDGEGDASRSDVRTTPSPQMAAKPLSYEQKMAKAYPLAAKLTASGKFRTVAGTAKAPGKGQKYRYRIDVEYGLGLDSALFAQAVQETLNDDRSWAHDGDMTFERISTGKPDFVITLASPGTTGEWCEKSGLDTMEDNVSCDSAATERVMINAYRWAQGSSTFGPDKLFAYRQMLINHEVGHRLGHNHVSCGTKGALAPVMQQQTKSLDLNGIKCLPNAWVYPKG